MESHINLGTLYKKKGQSEKGIESYRKALVINPHHGETHYNLGLLYEQVGKVELAIHHYQRFVLLSSGAYPELVSRVRRHIQQMLKTKDVKKERGV
ncbi:MAG: tetratricopeptide repeat protein [Deltaproteobacteria bacterium]|nr:tetratricopeptide repeat protein [Deltaproteobacteria bacterium]